MKNICIYGLGAVGGLMAARLAAAGYPVKAIARGQTLQAVSSHGLVLHDAQGERRLNVEVAAESQALGPMDLVILSVKTSGLTEIAQHVKPLIGPDTTVLSAMNGIPWWFSRGLQQAPSSLRLDSVDPDRAVSDAIAHERVLGCVTHLSAAVSAPGVVRHVAGNRLIVGEPLGGCDTKRAQAVAQMLDRAGFEVDRAPSIQQEIWFKLWGNMTMNPVSFITGATGDRILDDDLLRAFLSRCMVEAAAIGDHIGLPITAEPEDRHAVTRKLGAFKTSMLQDLEASKPIELDALVSVVIEIGRQVQVPTPNLDALLGMTRVKARQLALYPQAS